MRLQETAVKLTNLFAGLVELGLGLRFVFMLFGANTANGFVTWVYSNTNVLLDPFRNIFHTHVIGNHYVLDFNTLFAMLVYALAGLLALSLVRRWSK